MNTDEGEGPGPGAGGLENHRQGLFENPAGHTLEGWRVRAAQYSAQGPQGAAMAVVGAGFFQPITLVIHKIPKASGLRIEGIADESEIAGSQFEGLAIAQFLQESADDQCPGVVVDAVTLPIIGYGESGVLQHPGVIRHE